MRTETTIENVEGQRKKVQTVKYSNGDVHKRVYNKIDDIVPEDVIFVTKGNRGPAPEMDPIEHKEIALYRSYYDC